MLSRDISLSSSLAPPLALKYYTVSREIGVLITFPDRRAGLGGILSKHVTLKADNGDTAWLMGGSLGHLAISSYPSC